MGTYTELAVGGYPLLTTKSEVIPEVMTLFRESDRRVFTRRRSERNPLVWGPPHPDDERETETAVDYACDTPIAIDRLNVMGFTLERARQDFERGVATQLEACGPDDDGSEWLDERRRILGALTFDAYTGALQHIIENGLRPRPFDDSSSPRIDEVVKFVLDEDEDTPFGFFGDVRLLVRVACTLVAGDARVVQDITELVSGGFYGPDEPVCEHAIQALIADHPANAPRIVLTEGSSDGEMLKAALSLLYPHLAGYYTFMDFGSSRAPGGAAQLVAVVKAFAAAGITNRVIALFDNDTAARDAVRSLATVSLPPNIAVLHYPPLDTLRNYPTLGPTGLAALDVNGLAASVELYVGDDVLGDDGQERLPVQWRGFVDALRAYQGEVSSKTLIRERFEAKIARCRANPDETATLDWSGMHAIFRALFSAFA
jgi:hypothetical protein